jgi:hypothetical protein
MATYATGKSVWYAQTLALNYPQSLADAIKHGNLTQDEADAIPNFTEGVTRQAKVSRAIE